MRSDFRVLLGGHLDEIVVIDDSVLILVGVLDHGGDLVVGEPLANSVGHQGELSLSEVSLALLIELLKQALKGGFRLGVR